ncbi:MAG TPA: response regulator transcription factor [Mycobacterium sp.]|nr:response regulator transcription factor [Mycobacterium sp.]
MGATSPARVVVVEDEGLVSDAIAAALRAEGLSPVVFDDHVGADRVLAEAPDLLVVDVILPHGDGFDLARKVLARRDVPVIFVTARDGVRDRLEGFSVGADDYLPKPFALEELLARVRVVLRRRGRLEGALRVGDLVVDEASGDARRGGAELGLTPTELRLLAFFVRHRGLVLSKPQLLTQVWGYDAYDPNVVEVHVSALRRKLEQAGPRIIHTVHGLGYRLSVR